jgi:hypothetical protein
MEYRESNAEQLPNQRASEIIAPFTAKTEMRA